MKTIYILYPDLDDDTEFQVTTSKLVAMTYFEVLDNDWTYETLKQVGHIVERLDIEMLFETEEK